MKVNLRFSGQSIAEYGLVGVLVVIVAIGGLTLLQQVFSQKMVAMNQTVSQAQNSLNRLSPKTVATTTGTTGTSTSPADIPDVTSAISTFGSSYNRSMYFVETGGTSGETDSLAAQIAKVAQELKLNDELSPEQYQALLDLSNQGHRMANIQNLIEQAWAQSNGNSQLFYSKSIHVDGVSYPIPELSYQFDKAADDGGRARFDILTQDLNSGGAEMFKLRGLFKKAADSGALQNQNAKDLVTDLSFEIFQASDGFQNNVYDNQGGGNNLTALVSSHYSEPNHKNSQEICIVGNGIDEGKVCK